LTQKVQREKLSKRETPFWKGYSPLHPRHLLKKVDENFQCLCLQYNKIKSFHGSDELSVKASLEKLLIIRFSLHKPTLMFQKLSFHRKVFGSTFFQKGGKRKNTIKN